MEKSDVRRWDRLFSIQKVAYPNRAKLFFYRCYLGWLGEHKDTAEADYHYQYALLTNVSWIFSSTSGLN